MTEAPLTPAERADAWVLGLLDPAEAAEVEAALAHDPALAGAVAAARDRFLALDLTAPDEAAPPALWDRIAAEIAEAPAPRMAEVVPLPARPGRGWRTTALASLAASALLAAGLVWQVMQAAPPDVVAILLDAAGEPVVLVEARADNTTRVTMLADVSLPAGQAMQLWTKPDPAGPPVSLGLLSRAAETVVRPGDLPAPQAAQLYEITFEAAAGSPTGLPTGPILGKGLAKLPR